MIIDRNNNDIEFPTKEENVAKIKLLLNSIRNFVKSDSFRKLQFRQANDDEPQPRTFLQDFTEHPDPNLEDTDEIEELSVKANKVYRILACVFSNGDMLGYEIYQDSVQLTNAIHSHLQYLNDNFA